MRNPSDEKALEWLTKNQRQLDQDGVEVGVSRQALDELLSAYRAYLEATQAGESEAVNDVLAAEAELRIVRKDRDAMQADNERLRDALELAVSRGCNHCAEPIKQARIVAGVYPQTALAGQEKQNG